MKETKVQKLKIGDIISIYEIRNTTGEQLSFYGVNKDKTFMPTVADTNELDNTKYKVINKNMFVFSGMQTGRDICIRLALYDSEQPVLISPAYTSFIIKDENEILPKYLFLFFYRFEMDRYGAFLSDGSIRANLDWDRFCEIKIPLPSIEVQRSLVAVYEGLEKLVADNEALIEQLEKVCHDFVINCKRKYPKIKLGDYIEECDERNSDNDLTLDDVRGISVAKTFIPTKADMDGVSLTPYKIVKNHWFGYVTVTSRNGERISLALYTDPNPAIVSSSYIVFRSQDEDILLPEYLNLLFNRSEFDRYARFNSWGSARETFDFSEMRRVVIPLPPIEIQKSIAAVAHCLQESRRIVQESRELMKNICPALVQKAAHSA